MFTQFSTPGNSAPLVGVQDVEKLPANQLLNQTGAESAGDGGKDDSNEAVIKMIIQGRSPTMRHVSRTHRVELYW